MNINQLLEGEVIERNGVEFVVVRIFRARRGFRSIVATTDGLAAHLGTRCTCNVFPGSTVATVRAIDLVTDVACDVCVNCRMRRLSC